MLYRSNITTKHHMPWHISPMKSLGDDKASNLPGATHVITVDFILVNPLWIKCTTIKLLTSYKHSWTVSTYYSCLHYHLENSTAWNSIAWWHQATETSPIVQITPRLQVLRLDPQKDPQLQQPPCSNFCFLSHSFLLWIWQMQAIGNPLTAVVSWSQVIMSKIS